MKLPFGKYQHRELESIPRPYLRWLREQRWLGGWLVEAIDQILDADLEAEEDGCAI